MWQQQQQGLADCLFIQLNNPLDSIGFDNALSLKHAVKRPHLFLQLKKHAGNNLPSQKLCTTMDWNDYSDAAQSQLCKFVHNVMGAIADVLCLQCLDWFLQTVLQEKTSELCDSLCVLVKALPEK